MTYFVNSRKDHDVVFTFRDITVNQVLSILKRVSPNKSAGIDGINVRLLRLAAPVITLSIARIIDYAFSLSGVLLVDYCKAFDIVDHNLLLLKLAYGFTNRAYNWCHSYLSGRRQLVCIDGKESSLACVNHGVPQGSFLAPLFFILMDLLLYIKEQGEVPSTPSVLPYPLYHGGGMTLRVRSMVQCAFSSQNIALRLR